MGPEVREFEKEFAQFQRTRHAFAVANGTGALHLALAALDLQPGDEVIQPAMNFVAAANMTKAVGALPVFADIVALDEPTIDPAHIEALITPRTKAVIVVHYGGYLCRMDEINPLCRKHNLHLVEDACHAIGVTGADGKMAGSIGDVGAFSFFSNKNLATGEGGMVITDRDDLADRIRLLRSHGMSTLSWDRQEGHAQTYNVSLHGFNYRLDDFHGALGRAQLKKLLPGNRRRAELSALYHRQLAQTPDWIIPFEKNTNSSANHLMPLVVTNGETRNKTVAALKAEGIQTSFHYPSITKFTSFAQYAGAEVPKSVAFASRVITLPMHPMLSDDDVEVVCSTLLTAQRVKS
jgi:dTDP-4-amino-4,6-dideoxygalactose transaminase